MRQFNGTELIYPSDPLDLDLDQLLDTNAIVNCGDAQPMGAGSYCGDEYWSRQFPRWLQDAKIPIHLKEFWTVIVSARLWGDTWRGHLVYIFCDNTAVVDVLDKENPRIPTCKIYFVNSCSSSAPEASCLYSERLEPSPMPLQISFREDMIKMTLSNSSL